MRTVALRRLDIVNLVITADLKQSVDLNAVSRLQYTIFDPKIYGGRLAYIKTPGMNGKVSIFNSGKLISVGCKSTKQAIDDLQKVVEILSENKIIQPIQLKTRLRNIVALLHEPYKIDLETLSNKESVMYEPEQFPGAILKIENPKATFLIFASGKVIISGAKSFNDLKRANKKIHEITSKYA